MIGSCDESRAKGLELNNKKTEVMVISRKLQTLSCKIKVQDKELRQVDKFKYLGTTITSDGRSNTEIKTRITQAKIQFQKMKAILTNRKLSIQTRKRVLQCYIEPILLYGCETWTITKTIMKRIEATEMWFLRRMLKVPWTMKETNENILRQAETKRSLINKIRKRQATFFGHVMRREKMEHLVTTGKIEGKRARGRQREKMLDGLAKWMGTEGVNNLIRETFDREVWKDMIVDAYQQDT